MRPDGEETGPAYLLPTTGGPAAHPAVYLLPHPPERRTGAIMSKLGAGVSAQVLSDGRLLWSLPGTGPTNRAAAALLPGHRPAPVRGTALITGGTEPWPEGLTTYQAGLTRAELDAAALLVRQQNARRATAAALHEVARDTGRSIHDVRRCLAALCGCDPERATPAQLETVRLTLLRT